MDQHQWLVDGATIKLEMIEFQKALRLFQKECNKLPTLILKTAAHYKEQIVRGPSHI